MSEQFDMDTVRVKIYRHAHYLPNLLYEDQYKLQSQTKMDKAKVSHWTRQRIVIG